MDEDMVLKHPTDRRMGNSVELPPGPPGVDGSDVSDPITSSKNIKSSSRRRSTSRRRSNSRRRSSSRNAGGSPSSRRRRSPSRSPTPPSRRGRYESPGRYTSRRRYDRRRSPGRRRSPPRRGGRRYGRSRSRSISPIRRSGRGGSRSPHWSPNKKPASPPMPPPTAQQMQAAGPPPLTHPGGPYNVMPPQMYGQGPYGAPPPTVYGHQYGMPPPNAFQPQAAPPPYAMQGPPPTQPDFNTGYGPPPQAAWGVNEYDQQAWMPQPMPGVQQAPPEVQQQAVPPQPQQMLTVPEPIVTENQHTPVVAAHESVGGVPPPQDAVAQEAENQKDELKKQRTNYIKKVALLNKEMKILKEQRADLSVGNRPPTPTTQDIIVENERLQAQMKKKLDTIENVIDMLNGIIGDGDDPDDEHEDLDESAPPPGKPQEQVIKHTNTGGGGGGGSASSDSSGDSSDSSSSSSSSSDSSSDGEDDDDDDDEENGDGSPTNRLKNRAIKSMKAKQRHGEATTKSVPPPTQNYNFVFFDPEQHWCASCNVFPKTARDYLKHLHSEEHMNRDTMETPWHISINHDPFPAYENAPTKRVPVRGMQFLVPATAWYCKLCSVWIGDLHCASAHLKSKIHSNRYDEMVLKKNPNYETQWLAERESALQQHKENEEVKLKKSKKEDDKKAKKSKKKSNTDKKKKKRKHGKKNKRANANSTSSSSDSSSEDESQQPKKGRTEEEPQLNQTEKQPPIAPSIRVAMRKQEGPVPQPVAPPPPPIKGKWITTVEEAAKVEENKKRDETMMQQWNTVQPVISESEKKLLEQLKGKLKTKGRDGEESTSRSDDHQQSQQHVEEKSRRGGGGRRSRSPAGKRRTRSPSRSRSRGRHVDVRRDRDRERDRERERDRHRSRSRSRGRRRYSRSPVRNNRRSRSRDNRRRRSRTRSRSRSPIRVERPVVKYSEFRPRAPPERKNDAKKDKKEPAKSKTAKSTSSNNASAAATAAANGGKKLPFIGKMPVFKKQPTAQPTTGYTDIYTNGNELTAPPPPPPPATIMGPAAIRPPAPTAAQIQMAMMEDVYGNAPPFHPDAGMMVDYDELMPDPVQFHNLMSNCQPPPPPPGNAPDGDDTSVPGGDEQTLDDEVEDDVLPPGIDEVESDLPKSLEPDAQPRDGELPKDLAEALDIIFPSGRPDGETDEEASKSAEPQSITTIVDDSPVLDEAKLQDLANQGIHILTIEETSSSAMPSKAVKTIPLEATPLVDTSMQIYSDADDDDNSQGTNATNAAHRLHNGNGFNENKVEEVIQMPHAINFKHVDAEDIPMPESPPPFVGNAETATNKDMNVGDIPQPDDSSTDSEKLRRQAELEELAMLGIDTSDLAAQYALQS